MKEEIRSLDLKILFFKALNSTMYFRIDNAFTIAAPWVFRALK